MSEQYSSGNSIRYLHVSEQDIAGVSDSLERCAEAAGDITEEVYQRFFKVCGNAVDLMGHSDQYMKGRMLAQVVELLLTDEHMGEEGYLRWEVDNHVLAYGVDVGMYNAFLDALRDTVRDAVGDAWGPAHAKAWAGRVDSLLEEIYAEAQA